MVRDRIGAREDRFFATVFLGSGLLFVAMLFVAAAVAGGLITAAAAPSSGAPGPETLALGRRVTALLLNLYAMRMAAVFTIMTVTIALRTGIIRRWLGYVGLRGGARAPGRDRRLPVDGVGVPRVDPGAEHRHPRSPGPARTRVFRETKRAT